MQVADAAEREATLSTVQVDFYQPERFGLEYVGPDGGRHRPVMVHRSVVGSMERAVAHLLERHGGAFPDWLAPEQVVVLPVTDAHGPAAAAVGRAGGRSRAAGPRRRAGVRHPGSPYPVRAAGPLPGGHRRPRGRGRAGRGPAAGRAAAAAAARGAALAGIAAHVSARRPALWDAAA